MSEKFELLCSETPRAARGNNSVKFSL